MTKTREWEPLRFEIPDADDRDLAMKAVEFLQSIGAVVRIEGEEQESEEPPAPYRCELCLQRTTEVHLHEAMRASICLACYQVAERLGEKFRKALHRHREEFNAQLAQIVKDVRAGNDEPTFYRGFE